MLHLSKGFQTFARDYGVQDAAGIGPLVPALFAVTIVDDVGQYSERTLPTFGRSTGQAAVAAVFGVIDLAATTLALRVLGASVDAISGATEINALLGIADLRTANTSTAAPVGVVRGQAAATAVVGTGTAASAASTAMWSAKSAATPVVDQVFGYNLLPLPIILRPGERLSFIGTTANILIGVSFWWQELTYPLPANPPLF